MLLSVSSLAQCCEFPLLFLNWMGRMILLRHCWSGERFGLNCCHGHLHPQKLCPLVTSAQDFLVLCPHAVLNTAWHYWIIWENKTNADDWTLSCVYVHSCFWSAAVVEGEEGPHTTPRTAGLCAKLPETNGKMHLRAGPSIHKRLNKCFWNAGHS